MGNKIIWFIVGLMVLALLYMFAFSGDNTEEQVVETPTMSFFVTSRNPGQGANFGGISGADNHCQSLAQAVGEGGKTWRAYLSTQATGTVVSVDAKDRIGTGPWYNADGVLIANTVAELHGTNFLNKQTALDENGNMVSGRGDPVNDHDILTGTETDGTAFATSTDVTCGNWTLGTSTGSAYLGHHDRMGPNDSDWAKSWNSSHASRGCGLDQLRRTGGAGLLYCFASN